MEILGGGEVKVPPHELGLCTSEGTVTHRGVGSLHGHEAQIPASG